jgi:hypothetical protein
VISQGKRGLVPRALKEFVIGHLPFVICYWPALAMLLAFKMKKMTNDKWKIVRNVK